MLGLGLALTERGVRGAALVSPLPPPLSAIDAGGWSAQYNGAPPSFLPDTAPASFAVLRQGWSATAGAGDTATAGTVTESRTLTQRVRQPAPNDIVPTAATVALDDYIYATDAVSGVANNSTEASPKPIAKWRVTPRRLVDAGTNLCPVALSAEHRDGIACVVFSLTDGTTTLTRTVVTPVVANRAGDQGAVIEYQWTFDTTGLASGRLTLSAKVYPRIGAAASVLSSAAQAAETRAFCNLYLVKGTRRYVYVASGGNDANGVVSASAATAAANPCATVAGALAKAMTGGNCSGLEIRLGAGTWNANGQAYNFYQDAQSAEVVITRDPAVPRGNVIWSGGFGYLSCVRLHELMVARPGYAYFNPNAGGQLALSSCDVDLGNQGIPLSDSAHYYDGDCNLTNAGGALLTQNIWSLRGVRAGTIGGPVLAVDNWDVAGCLLRSASVQANGGTGESGGMIEGTIVRFAGSGGVSVAQSGGTTGYAMRNVVVEHHGGAANTGMLVSGDDPASGNTAHVVLRGVTCAGANNAGRANVGYDESAGTTRRTHKLWRVEGCNFGQVNTKSDRFVRDLGNADAGNRTGGWSVNYGVGWRGNVHRFPNAAGGGTTFGQDYPGLGAMIAASAGARIDVGFGDEQATTFDGAAYAAGAGGGTYSVASGSPAKGMLTGGRLAFDIGGAARAASDTAGAYA